MSSNGKWTTSEIPDQSGRVAVVTGANTGLGYALPTLRAATDPDVEGGQYYGPDGLGQQRGHPKVVPSSTQSHDEDLQHRPRGVSEELTGVTYPV